MKARITASTNTNDFNVRFFKGSSHLNIHVRGPATGTIPYVQSIILNNDEICNKPTSVSIFVVGRYSFFKWGNILMTSPVFPNVIYHNNGIQYTYIGMSNNFLFACLFVSSEVMHGFQ